VRVVAGVLVVAFLVAGCGGSGDGAGGGGAAGATGTCSDFKGAEPLTVGGTTSPEQEIVAELYAQCAVAAGYKIEKKFKLGPREVVFPALEKGDIDLYPEYVGTLLTYLKGTPAPDIDRTLAELQQILDAKALRLLEPAQAEEHLEPPDNVVPVVRAAALKGDLEALLNSISAKLTTENLAEMKKAVDVDKQDPAGVARQWLVDFGFLARP
jgi:glycine betaine/choline ABC-type transport system substrate-binding protein